MGGGHVGITCQRVPGNNPRIQGPQEATENHTYGGAVAPFSSTKHHSAVGELSRKMTASQHRPTCLKNSALASKVAKAKQGLDANVYCALQSKENPHVKNLSFIQLHLLRVP